VLEHRLDDKGIDALVRRWTSVSIGDELNGRASVHVDRESAQSSGGVESLDAFADRSAADHEDERPGLGQK
jgi:hypothetical protein